MDSMDTDLQSLIASYFDCGWEEFENDPKVKDIIIEMKGLADIYLKTKSSKNSSMVTTIAMEAELKRLRAELVKRVEKLKKDKDSKQPVEEVAQVKEQEVEVEEEIVDDEPVVEMKLPKKKSSSSDKLPAIALGSAILAILLSAASFFSSKDKMSRDEFNDFNRTTRESIMKDVGATNQSDRTDIEALQGSLQVLRQDLEASKQELASIRAEMDQRLNAQETHLNAKISSLQESLKKSQKKAPVAAAKTKAAPLKTAPAKAKTTKPIRR